MEVLVIFLLVGCVSSTIVLDSMCKSRTNCIINFQEKGTYVFRVDHPTMERITFRPRFSESALIISNVRLSMLSHIELTACDHEDICQVIILGEKYQRCIRVNTLSSSRTCCNNLTTQSLVTLETTAAATTKTTTSVATTAVAATTKTTTSVATTAVAATTKTTTSVATTAANRPSTSLPLPHTSLHQNLSSHQSETVPFRTAAISLGIAAGTCIIALVLLLIFHRLKVIKIKRMRLPMLSASFSPTSSTFRKTNSEPSLNTSFSEVTLTVASPDISTVASPDQLVPAHKYPTRYQKRIQIV